MRRPVQMASWMRLVAQMPDFCVCTEVATLYGLGAGRGFVVHVSTEVTGAPLSDHFSVLARYKASAMDGGRSTQLDGEAQIEWKQSSMLKARVEQAVLKEFQRTFEASFLPLATRTLAARAAAAAPAVGRAPSSASAAPAAAAVAVALAVPAPEGPGAAVAATASLGGAVEARPTTGSVVGPRSSQPPRRLEDFLQEAGAPPSAAAAAPAAEAPGPEPEPVQAEPSTPAALPDEGDGSPSGIEAVYDGEWSHVQATRFELRVEVLAASDLRQPEYRLGDGAVGLLKGAEKLLANVYVQLQVGMRKVVTEPAENSQGERSVGFFGERFLFAYAFERSMTVRVFDRRGMQAMFRGDPVIGEGELALGADATDCLPRWADVPIQRGSREAGSVSLRYQLLPLDHGAVAVPSGPHHGATLAHQGPSRASRAGGPDEFVTPPATPRGATS